MDALHEIKAGSVSVTVAREVRTGGQPQRFVVDPRQEAASISSGKTITEGLVNAFDAGRRYGQLECSAGVFERVKANVTPLHEPVPSLPLVPMGQAGPR